MSSGTGPGLKDLFKDTLGDFRRLPSNRTMGLLVVGTAFTAAVHPFDARVTSELVGSTGNAEVYSPGRVLGGAQFQFGAAVATYGIGRLTGHGRAAEVGAHLIRAQIVSQVTTQVIKVAVSRTRPDGSTQNSFPSGHTSVSFASATILQREFGWKVGLPAYAVASYIGLSRIEHERHYLSDVVFGAAIGVVSARAVGFNIAGRRFNMTPVASPGGGAGVSFVWTDR
jgi:membrane-associated phospholipid phosphatase